MGFFTEMRSWFKADFDGRYLGLILAEIGKKHPPALVSLLNSSCGIPKQNLLHPRFQAEYSFRGKRGIRRADLAVFEAGEIHPSVLIEIKYHDKPLPETDLKPNQLDDYQYWKKRDPQRRYVIVLSRETMQHGELTMLRWTEAARLLKVYSPNSDLVMSLIEHLKEEGMVMQDIKTKELIGFLKRLLCGYGGAGQLAGNVEGPAEFAKLLNNMKLLAGRFNNDFKEAWSAAGNNKKSDDLRTGTRIASIDFGVWNRLSTNNPKNVFPDDDGWIHQPTKDGGYLEVFARHALGSGQGWLRINYGIYFDIDKKSSHEKERNPKVYIFAQVRGQIFGNESSTQKKRLSSFDMVTSKAEKSSDKLEIATAKQLLLILNELLEVKNKLTSQQRAAIKHLKKSFMRKLKPSSTSILGSLD